MNTLDILPQNVSRRTDGFPTKSAPSPNDAGDSNSGADSGLVFATLIQDLSDSTAMGEGIPPDASSARLLAAARLASREKSDEAVDASAESDSSVVTQAIPGWTDLALLIEQPRIAAQQAAARQDGSATPRTSPGSPSSVSDGTTSLLNLLGSQSEAKGEAEEVINLSNVPKQRASVLHQEAHFKPVLPVSSAEPVVRRSTSDQSAPPRTGTQDEAASRGSWEATEIESGVAVKNAERGRVDASAPARVADPDAAESPSMHPAAHRVASVIIEDAKSTADRQDLQVRQSEAFSVVGTNRPSEGVVRMLDIQLHPVELGTVTVKMKLSGDRLEMELHASSNEAADVLKRDSEKLSSLLRMSGYRPDALTIHTTSTDSSQQGSAFGQRQPSADQSSAGSSQQGASGSDERQQGRQQGPQSPGLKASKDELDESLHPRRNIGGLYL
ncbi:flagellar hook-length control protein FliK [Microvirga terricola]|uniref:Flagellar hook-length control protein-like C-terminal domain-containing protein n=1 Tax=Microvirga terricola TaxID=2719797 RepID=A0ABX0V8H0_9HYPH|nr:flagellar hook-length control protein FliK [Microvirga terricola]NIX75000.1 hypothetical protein [Microvirga terricola]